MIGARSQFISRAKLQPAQEDVGGNGARVEDFKEVLSSAFDEGPVANQIKGVGSLRHIPSGKSGTLFAHGHLVHNKLPRAGESSRIAGAHVGASDLHIDKGLTFGLVLNMNQAHGLRFVARVEGFLLPGLRVLAVVSAPASSE
jgi:hypothetical protein